MKRRNVLLGGATALAAPSIAKFTERRQREGEWSPRRKGASVLRGAVRY